MNDRDSDLRESVAAFLDLWPKASSQLNDAIVLQSLRAGRDTYTGPNLGPAIDAMSAALHQHALAGEISPVKWTPIYSAPVGEDVLCYSPDAAPEYRVMILHRFDGEDEWYAQDVDAQPNAIDVAPTHWMPLPSAPEA